MALKKSSKRHIFFWVLLLISFAVIPYFQEGNVHTLSTLILYNLKRMPFLLIGTYSYNDILIPRFYKSKKFLLFTVCSILMFYSVSALDRVFNVYVYETLFREPPFVKESLFEIFSDVTFLITGYLPPILFASLAMALDRLVQAKQDVEKRNTELEGAKNRAELNALKSQIHPHFLFNTLNNLYTLTLQKSDEAPKTVARLSEMLDYILYQCNDKFVSLQKELDLLDNYIALESLRYGEDIEIQKDFELTNSQMTIAPLLLLSILENAFKHGASGSIDIPKIHIKLVQEGAYLFVSVKNTKNDLPQQDDTGYSKGIGVNNVKQQLELLYYEFSYEVTDKEGWYIVNLKINTQKIKDEMYSS